jgi:hypothetical protein
MMTKEITMSEDELRQKLEIALEGGRALGAREAAQGSSEDQLRAEFGERVAELMADRRKTPAKARAIQQEFIEKGLSVEEVDLAPRGSAVDERHNDLQSASYRRVIGPRSR